ncbi:MAG: type II toxin-antitoxin system HipA family toxin [Alcaligenaceae bacterium]|nr:type II toxin-antitoxin system HipA family toxin [Alcaligenaceae bacterium SAGV5]MPS55208.1 type II toxin-antitoxin system HipA family toxin [Alcaligenaceae bacterium SAGV3]MPT59501.1 type II toxin-antitoxin system HipA family toxin [Alcaligenaceae bacterium]
MARRRHTLGLWMNGSFVGTWSNEPRVGESLQYDLDWVEARQGRPLSRSLSFTPGNVPLRGGAVRAYFENLLPDNDIIRERVARRYRLATIDAFDLLGEIGRDCVGALQILPEGMSPGDIRRVDATPLAEAEVAHLLRHTIQPSPLADASLDQDDFRISIAGAQEKTALLYDGGRWCKPHGSTPTTHIFKFPLGAVGPLKMDLSASVENEWLCAEILRAYGLPVARCEPLRFEDMRVLCVERFDRVWAQSDDGVPWLIRRPQEDMCQATGTPPHLKYESEGGPGMARIMEILRGSLHPDRDRRQFFQAQVLFWMLCAIDGHAKNFSLFIRSRGAYEMTPLYDVLSAHPVLGEGPHKLSPFRARMAMAVRGKNPHKLIKDIRRRHWLTVGERHGIVSAEGQGAQSVIDDLVARTPGVVQTVRARLPKDFPEELADSILNGLQASAGRLAA